MAGMSIKELSKKKSDKRKSDYHSGKPMKGIMLRKHIHFLISLILKIDQIISKEKIVVLNDRHRKTKKSVIFACTHIGGNEIQRTFQAISSPAYIMLGDPGILYRDPSYLGLQLTGVIPLETLDKEDRKLAYYRAVELLKKGGNLLIFPEAAWNLTPDLPVMKIFTGTVRMAKETGCEIVPIALQQYGKTFYFNIGENYSIPQDTNLTIKELNDDLRSKMATLAWEIPEHFGSLDIRNLQPDCVEQYQNEIVNRSSVNPGLSIQDVLDERFHDKSIVEYDDAFAHLSDINLCRENVFLFNKRNHN